MGSNKLLSRTIPLSHWSIVFVVRNAVDLIPAYKKRNYFHSQYNGHATAISILRCWMYFAYTQLESDDKS